MSLLTRAEAEAACPSVAVGGGLGDAIFSPDGRYRYLLSRVWGNGDWCNFIMLNPSTATDTEDDPTVTRCRVRAKRWGFGGMYVTNLFALRSTDPRALRVAVDPVGLDMDNDCYLHMAAQASTMVICAWGGHGALHGRWVEVLALLRGMNLYSLGGPGKTGQPRHPLYLSYSVQPRLWMAASRALNPRLHVTNPSTWESKDTE